MSLETFVEDWRKNDSIDEFRLEQKIRIYEKFVDRIEEIIQTYDPGQYKNIEPSPEELESLVDDLKYEVESVKEGIEEV